MKIALHNHKKGTTRLRKSLRIKVYTKLGYKKYKKDTKLNFGYESLLFLKMVYKDRPQLCNFTLCEILRYISHQCSKQGYNFLSA